MTIAATAMITVANAEPENKKKPPRAESSVTFDKSSSKTSLPSTISPREMNSASARDSANHATGFL
jgi:hypothetical protein